MRVCRTCLKPISQGGKYYVLGGNVDDTRPTLLRNQLKACIPEIAVDISKDPIICSACCTALCTAYEFRTKCVKNEEKIRSFVKQTKHKGALDLEKVVDVENEKVVDVDSMVVEESGSGITSVDVQEAENMKIKQEIEYEVYINEFDEVPIKAEIISTEVEVEPVCEESADKGHMVYIKSEDPLSLDPTPSTYNPKDDDEDPDDPDPAIPVLSDSSDPEWIVPTETKKTKKKVYKCETCERLYTNKPALEAHLVQYPSCRRNKLKRKRDSENSSGEGCHICQTCNKSFTTIFALNDHMKVQHIAVQKGNLYDCDTCGKQFKWKAYLIVHQRTHKNNVKCEICKVVFDQESAYKVHMNKKHNKAQKS